MPAIDMEPELQAHLKRQITEFTEHFQKLKTGDKTRGAIFNQERTRRYLLWRCWDWGGIGSMAVFISGNPRNANECKEDSFTRKFKAISKSLGFSGYFNICLWPLITSDKYRLRDDLLNGIDILTEAEQSIVRILAESHSKYSCPGSMRICRGRALNRLCQRHGLLMDRITYTTTGSRCVASFGNTLTGLPRDVRRLGKDADPRAHIRNFYYR